MDSRVANFSTDGHADVADLLAHIPLFARLVPPQIAQLSSATRKRLLAKGQVLFHKGESLQGLFAVVFGRLKLAIPSAAGNEKVVEVFGAGQTFGEAAMVLDMPSLLTAEALTDSLVLSVDREALLELLRNDLALAHGLVAGLSTEVQALVSELDACSLQSAVQRVITYLLHHCPEDANEGGVVISLPVPKQVIASQLNLTPETLSRVFHDLSDAKLIALHGREVTVPHVERLRAFAC